MSSHKQKHRERVHFDLFKDWFKRLYGQWREGEEDHKDNQKPDFLIKYSDKTLGIEHTELFMAKGPHQAVSLQQREGSLWSILDDAKIICEKRGIPPLEVKVWFSTSFEESRLKAAQAKQLSRRLADFVAEEHCKGVLPRTYNEDDLNERLPEISDIGISPGVSNGNTCLTDHRWTKLATGARQTQFVAELQKCIDDKNQKYEEYISNCNECWLLIVAERKNPAQNLDIDSFRETAAHTYQSKFKRTFYLEVTHRRLVPLKTTWR